MNASEFAEKRGIPYQTVARWLKQGIIPGVKVVTAGRVRVYLIPESAMTFERPKTGRPTKTRKAATKKGR